jgi:hemoglobin
MKKRMLSMSFLTLILLFGLVLVPAGGRTYAQQAPAGPSLYERLGGFDAIAAVTDDFLARMVKDPQLSRFFEGDSADSMRRARELTVEFICKESGGPCFYIGRPMKTTHRGLGITAQDWEIAMVHLGDTLNKFKVPAAEQTEVKGFFESLRPSIVDSEIAGK